MMKKNLILCVLLIFITISTTSCINLNENIVISEDYMTIHYNSERYKISELYMSIPEDAIEHDNPVVENEDIFYYLLPICGDVVYISESEPNYLWLVTETDCTEDEKFQEIRSKNYELLYVREGSE